MKSAYPPGSPEAASLRHDHPAAPVLLALVAALSTSCAGEDPRGLAEAGAGDRVLALRGATVIDIAGGAPLADATVLVREGRIRWVGADSAARVPADARQVDAEGKFMVPGLWDMHVHLSKARASALRLLVANGVLGVRDMGGDWPELERWRREIRNGSRHGPRIVAAGPYLESAANVERMRREGVIEPVGRTRIPVDGPARARAVVDSIAREGVDLIKFRTVPDLATFRAITEAAHAAGLPVGGHVTGIRVEDLIAAAPLSIEHTLFPLLDSLSGPERRERFRALADSGVVMVPTLSTWPTTLMSREEAEELVDDSLRTLAGPRRYLSRFLLLDWREQVAEREEGASPFLRRVRESTLRNVREMHEVGLPVLVGSDVAVLGLVAGFATHEELERFVDDLGFSPLDALRAATILSARHLGMADSTGSVEAGKWADFVLLDRDPTEDIRHIREIWAVVRGGRFLGPDELDLMLAGVEHARDRRVDDWGRR